jgi:2-keto-4-pentenoate hydratase
MNSAQDDLARRLIAAHEGGEPVGTVAPELVPTSLEEVYALQDRVIAHAGEIGGWKIMAGGEGEPLCAPVPASRYYDEGAELDAGHHRLIIAEVEFAVKLGADLTPGVAVEQAIASLHPVLEFIANPFVDRDAMARNLLLGDLQSNGAIVVGPALDRSILDNLTTLKVGLDTDGSTVKTADTGASWTDVVAALGWLAQHAAARGLPLSAGQVIITGARVLAPLGGAAEIAGTLGAWGRVSARLKA